MVDLSKYYKELRVDQILMDKYVNLSFSQGLIERYVESPEATQLLTRHVYKILTSYRGNIYVLIRGFEELIALQLLGITSVSVRVDTYNSVREEELMYKAMNNKTTDANVYSNLSTPKSIDADIMEFCHSIVTSPFLEYIAVQPDSVSLQRKCFTNVERKVETSGGKKQCGWLIQKHANAFLRAVAHAIWISDNGEKIDITPGDRDSVLFLPDNSLPSDGYGIESRNRALTTSPFIEEYIWLHELFSLHVIDWNGQEDAAYRELLRFQQLNYLFRLEVGRNDPCPCQSKLKYKKCCGRG